MPQRVAEVAGLPLCYRPAKERNSGEFRYEDAPVLPSRLSGYLRSLREVDPSSDAALLARFAESRDPEAFELLVWRHGSLVLGICRRILRDHHAAEDAFQATFLILSRRAGSIRGSLAPWLHSVARRVALRTQKRRIEALHTDVAARAENPSLDNRELLAVLDAEIARLPEKQRRVVVLCYLENLTAEAAARELGIPRGTVLSRLDTARRKLQAALTRRGIAPLAILTVPLISASPSPALVESTQHALGVFTASPASTPITELATEVLQMTTRQWIAATTLGIVALAFASTGVGLFNGHGSAVSQAVAQVPAVKPDNPVAPDDAKTEKIKEQQLMQLLVLERSERELKDRIDKLNAQIAKEQATKDAEVSARALMQAIDKIDQSLLDEEVKLREEQTTLKNYQSSYREDKEYPLQWLGSVEVPSEMPLSQLLIGMGGRGGPWAMNPQAMNPQAMNPQATIASILSTIPEYVAHIKTLDTISRDGRGALPNKIEELKKLRADTITDFEKNTKADIEKKVITVRRDSHHDMLKIGIVTSKTIILQHEAFPKSVAKRRAELVDRLRKASGISEEQKLLEDELQVLRDFRKAVLKQKLTLRLEIEGVVLPVEPKK